MPSSSSSTLHSGAARLGLLAAALACLTTAAAAQGAPSGPWVPLGSSLDRDVRWAIDAGVIRLNPLLRPFRLAAVRNAAQDVDTVQLNPQALRALKALNARLHSYADSAVLRAEGVVRGYTNGRRETFRSGGRSRVTPALGMWGSYATGPLVAVVSAAIDERLRDDPEFAGDKTTEVTGRMQTAYVAMTGSRGDVLLGRMARNWGPDLFDGLMLSSMPYAIDGLAGALRVGPLELNSVVQRLSSIRDTSTPRVDFNRYLFAHRLDIRLGRDAWLGLVESGVYGGRGQGFEPAFLNPLNLALASEFNDSLDANILLGADLSVELRPGLRLEASGFLDDIQTDDSALTDQRPTSYGLTATLRAALPTIPLHLALGYTRIAALSYRNSFVPEYEYSHQHVGLARNFSDYDEVLLRLSLRPNANWWVDADLAYFRQGSGDFRQPFPSDSVLAAPGQGFLVAPMRSFAAGRLTVTGDLVPGIELGGELGFTRDANGKAETIGAAGVRISADVLRRRLSGGFPAVERADRGWP